ncbi:MAG: hypothetical protein FJZ57_07915 [Chlamydiae bacterium]|nr:hypothetical protein [Chlamydiota bacterium]
MNKAKFSSVFVQRSVDWQDLFLCGTEVGGSCQRVDGEVHLNKCLLAYCLDGKNSLIAVKDSQGKILARRIFRLLINTDSNKPVLFLDTLYPSGCKTEYNQAIMSMAKSEALRLGIDLLVRGENPSLRYPGKVQSLGGRCPYEYADGASGISLNSVFSIEMPQQI